jgi:hypothetical protein
LIVAAAGADTINGLATLVLSSASTSVEVISDGTSKWYAVQSGSGGGGSGALSPPKSYEFVATAAQTSFSGADQNSKTLTYTPGGIQVFLKGRRLNLADYTATTGSTVVLGLPASTGDLLTIVDYGSGNASSFVAYEYTASAGQVTFTGSDANSRILTYSPGLVLVYVNGDLLSSGDYTATSGSSIVLGVARAVNDQIKIVAMNQSTVGLVPANNLSDVSSATTSRQNLGVDYATKSDQQTGTATNKVVTPSQAQSHDAAAKGWVQFSVSGGVVTVQASYNVTSVVRNSIGNFTVTWTTAFTTAFYACSITPQSNTGTHGTIGFTNAQTSTTVQILTQSTSFSLADPDLVSVIAYGRQ